MCNLKSKSLRDSIRQAQINKGGRGKPGESKFGSAPFSNKNLTTLNKKSIPYKKKRDSIIDNLAKEFDKHLNLTSLLN